MFCSKCGKDAGLKKICSSCGAFVNQENIEESPQIETIEAKPTPTVPIPKKKKGCLIGAVILIAFICALAFGITQIVQNPDKYGAGSRAEKSNNPNIQSFIDATGMTLEKATAAYEAFCKVSDGLSVIYTVTHDDALDNLVFEGVKGYRIKTEFSNNVVLYVLNGEIYSIRYVDYDYYIDGKVNGYFYDKNGKLIAGQKP